MEEFMAIATQTPDGLYEFLTENRSFVCDENIEAVRAKFEEALAGKNPRVQSIGAKLVFLTACKEHGVDAFFDALSSSPPNDVCTAFEGAMKEMMTRVMQAMKS